MIAEIEIEIETGSRPKAAVTVKERRVLRTPARPVVMRPPDALAMISDDHARNYGLFRDCTLRWQETPTWACTLEVGEMAYLSDETFEDPLTGASFRYHLDYGRIQFNLTRLYPDGSPSRDAILYSWRLGARGNTREPFRLEKGVAFPGCEICFVTIEGIRTGAGAGP